MKEISKKIQSGITTYTLRSWAPARRFFLVRLDKEEGRDQIWMLTIHIAWIAFQVQSFYPISTPRSSRRTFQFPHYAPT